MENQHRKISGYRELTQDEIDLMNQVKAMGPQLQALCAKLASMPDQAQGYDQPDSTVPVVDGSIDKRWLALGKSKLQEGLMDLTRSITRPTFF